MIDKKLTDSGVKAHQRDDHEDRAKVYRDWHRTLDPSLIASDVDLIEWAMADDGELIPVGVFELTRMDGNGRASGTYLEKIVERITDRDLQSRFSIVVAEALGVDARIILFNESLSYFAVYNLSKPRKWHEFGPEGWADALTRLQQDAIKKWHALDSTT